MPKRYYLKLDGVRGESTSPRHVEEIELTSFQWGMGIHTGGSGVGRAQISDLRVMKAQDRTSPQLWAACTTGQPFEEAIVTIEDISDRGSLMKFVKFTMNDVLVDSVKGDSRGETVGLTFVSVRMGE
jgi:type VI secretion system secreted protein Hcp